MRSPLFRRCNGFFVATVSFILLIIVFVACRRTEVLSRKSTLTVKEAKEWWYGVYRKSAAYTEIDKSSVFAATEMGSDKKYPSWKRAVTYQMGNFEVVEAPLVYENKSVLMPGMGDIVNTEEGRRIFKASNTKVLLFKSPDGSIDVRISTLVPSREYAKKKFYDLSDIHLNDIPEDFEGYQMVRKWNEEQVNTYTVVKGNLRTKQKLKKLGKGNFTLTADRKLIPKESVLPDLIAKAKSATTKRGVGSHTSSDKLQSIPNTIAEYVETCHMVWVPRVSEVCIVVHIADEPDEEVCDEHESDTEGEYEEKCETIWIPDEEPLDPCETYGINCPPGGGTTDPNDPQDPHDPPGDPCAEKRKRDSIAGALLEKNGIEESMDSLGSDVATNSNEKIFSFGRDANGNYRSTPIETGTDVSGLMAATDPEFTVWGGAHTHTSNGYSAFSVGDLYALYDANQINPYFQYMIVLAYNNDKYSLTITDKDAFTAFVSSHSKQDTYDADAVDWVTNSDIGADFAYAYQNLREQHFSPNKAHEGAMAYVMEKYNMGLGFSKADANGDFQQINYKADGGNGITITPYDPCDSQ